MTLINKRWHMELPEHREFMDWSRWELERNTALNKNIKPGDILLDVGSEQGDLPAMFATWGAQVFLMEPNPLFWPTIKQCFNMNDVQPIGAFAGFASNKDEMPTDLLEIPFQLEGDGLWPGCAFMVNKQNNDFRNVLERYHDTPQTKIDSLMLDRVDIINMDIEGSEFEALKGAEQTLLKDKPLVFVSIHPEFMENDYGYTKEDLLFWMAGLGYEMELLAIDHEHHYAFYHPKGKKYVR